MPELLKSKEEFLWNEWYERAVGCSHEDPSAYASARLREYRAARDKWKTYRSTLEC